MPKLLEGLKTWLQSMNDVRAPDVAVGETPEKPAEAPTRVDGKPAGQPHMGADYTISQGTPVRAAADGTVVVAEDHFYSGNAVYIDHGAGLVTMYFHLSEIKVKAGQEVKKGDSVGLVGTTGRSTGAHLFFGVRWHNARIDPKFLLENPADIPAVGSPATSATTTPRN